MKNNSPFLILAPYACRLESSSEWYGVNMGHFNNNRMVGYIDIDFDFKTELQYQHKVAEIKRLLGPHHPFKIETYNEYNNQYKCTYSTVRLLLLDELALELEGFNE